MNNLGTRISIIGSNSSVGKSTLADKLGNKLNLPVVHLDQLYHYPKGNWIARPKEEYLELHEAAVSNNEWIVEGNYTQSMDRRFERSTAIINIEMNRFGCMWRYVARHFADAKNPGYQIGRIDDSGKKFNWMMINWILWPKNLNKARRKKIRQKKALLEKHKDKLITLRSFKEIEKFVTNYPAAKNLSA